MRSTLTRTSLGKRLGLLALMSMVFAGLPVQAGAVPPTAPHDNTMGLSIYPEVPAEGEHFEVTAQGIVDATESGNVYLMVTIAPAEEECYPTSALEQSRAERTQDARWGVWWESFVGSNRPVDKPYAESRVFAQRPVGRYRLCGYLSGQGEGPDPYVATRLDFTVGGTCAGVTAEADAARAALLVARGVETEAASSAKKARKAVKKAKKQLRKAKKKARGLKGKAKAKKLKKPKKKVKRANRRLAKKRAALASARQEATTAEAALAAVTPKQAALCG